MDLVYERSWMTIVAAGGHDANMGLPGVYPTSRRVSNPTIEVVAETSLSVCSTLNPLMSTTRYSSRGWT